LVRGLEEKNLVYNINPSRRNTYQNIHVISNPEAVRWAISEVKRDKTKKLVVGPNVTILPSDDDSLLSDEHIQTILVPSEWTKEAHIQSSPQLKNKIRIWPAGVHIPKHSKKDVTSNKQTYILFIKNTPKELREFVLQTLKRLSVNFTVFTYGSFTHSEYLNALEKAVGMIYLQEVESQGIALQEAWSFDVPTLVWNKGTFTYPNTTIKVVGNISAPYQFSSESDFEKKMIQFMSKIDSFSAKAYCTRELSDEKSVEIYKKIILGYE
jgi:hypothetical protein